MGRNTLGIQTRRNMLTPDGALEECPGLNTVQWGSFPNGTANGTDIPVPPPSAPSATVQVYNAAAINLSAVSPYTFTLGFTPTAGHTLAICFVADYGANTSLLTVQDGLGNSFTIADGSGPYVFFAYNLNCSNSDSITITTGASQAIIGCLVFEIPPSTVLEVTANVTGVGTSGIAIDGPSLSSGSAALYLVGFSSVTADFSALAVNAPWALIANFTLYQSGVAAFNGNGGQQPQFTITVSGLPQTVDYAFAGIIVFVP